MDKHTDSQGNELHPDYARIRIAILTPADVRAVYSGRPGCMCGCKGKYSVNPIHRAEADKDRGYACPVGKRSMVMVEKVLRILQADPRTMLQDGYILYRPRGQDDERNYCVYLCNSARI